MNNYVKHVHGFKSKTQDFDKAYNFLMQSRFTELTEAGYETHEAQQMIANEERMLVEDAFNREMNPAERIYKMAKARGYAKEESEAEKQIKTVQKGLEASKNLKGGGTSAGLTLQSLADMSEEEFNNIDEAVFKKLLGG